MKKLKFIPVLTAMLLALAFTACSGEEEEEEEEDHTFSVADRHPPESTAPAITETEASTETSETVETQAPTETETSAETQAPTETETTTETQSAVSYKEMTVHDKHNTESYVRYPLQEGGKDADAVNALIRARVDEMLASIYAEDLDVPDVEWTCNIYVENYEITRDDEKYLSILWTGDWFHSLAAHPNNFAQGIIIDKSTMTEVKLTDLYTVDEAFVQKVQAQVDAQLHSVLAEKFDISTDDVKEITSEVTLDGLVQSGTQFGYGIPVCLAENGVIFSVYVPHYIGDHCEIEIPYEELA